MSMQGLCKEHAQYDLATDGLADHFFGPFQIYPIKHPKKPWNSQPFLSPSHTPSFRLHRVHTWQNKVLTGPSSAINPALQRVGPVKADKWGPETELDPLKHTRTLPSHTRHNLRAKGDADVGIRERSGQIEKTALSRCDNQLAALQMKEVSRTLMCEETAVSFHRKSVS